MASLLAAGALGAGAAPAPAATVGSVENSLAGCCYELWLVYTAEPGEANEVSVRHLAAQVRQSFLPVTQIGAAAVTDTGAPLEAGQYCVGGVATAVCAPMEFSLGHTWFAQVRVDTGDGDDIIDVVDTLRERVQCGPGVDIVKADVEDTIAADCEAVERL